MPLHRIYQYYWILLTLLAVSSCTESPKPIQSRKLLQLNPTSYTFKMSLPALHDTLLTIFAIDKQIDNPILKRIFFSKENLSDTSFNMQHIFTAESSDSAVFGKKYFQQNQNSNDIYLTTMAGEWPSTLYHFNGKPYIFSSEYILQLEKVNDNITTLNIKANNPVVYNGTRCCGPCLGFYSLTNNVKPTSIEEYTLILYVTDKLGIHNLKPLALPK